MRHQWDRPRPPPRLPQTQLNTEWANTQHTSATNLLLLDLRHLCIYLYIPFMYIYIHTHTRTHTHTHTRKIPVRPTSYSYSSSTSTILGTSFLMMRCAFYIVWVGSHLGLYMMMRCAFYIVWVGSHLGLYIRIYTHVYINFTHLGRTCVHTCDLTWV